MSRRVALPLLALAAGVLLLVDRPAAELYVWVDESGRTRVTDDPARVPESARRGGDAETMGLWAGDVADPKPQRLERSTSSEEDRVGRVLRGAVDDLRRGETARAAATLESVLRIAPTRPEAHWYLALLDRQRGRYESAEAHLRAFLSHAGDAYDDWRASAERRLAALGDERRLASEQVGPLRLVAADSVHFRIHYDEELGRASPDYARTVVGYLEEAHAHVAEALGVRPTERTGVVLYGKAAYLAAHRHRFSFPTVGFYDGRIHVASAAHPAGALRALLFHEYTHAVFAERAGGHRPFWLNEGLAELAERAARRQRGLTRSEIAALVREIESGAWIPLRDLAAGFGGLREGAARLAYLQATATAAWLHEHSTRDQRLALLDALGRGETADRALQSAVGLDTDAIDAAVRSSLRQHFPDGI
ncbi:MAG: DUF4124 domain-containing protein [Myxococcota bacterium]|nr:DUF4124 domain-containing protein [Myxococcota bacterium]